MSDLPCSEGIFILLCGQVLLFVLLKAQTEIDYGNTLKIMLTIVT